MGQDNLHHKRNTRETNNLQRRKSRREVYEKVLIVCEGKKTEPNYFKELIVHYKLNTANVAIDGNCNSSPESVLKRAEDLVKIEGKNGDPFDRVYCVFDKDTHASYDKTIEKIKSKTPKNTYYAAISVPCFEYWLLLHFDKTTKPYHAKGHSSVANEVQKELKKHFPKYDKGNKTVFLDLIDKIEIAKENALSALIHSKSAGTDNPSTYIHELVDYLQKLKLD